MSFAAASIGDNASPPSLGTHHDALHCNGIGFLLERPNPDNTGSGVIRVGINDDDASRLPSLAEGVHVLCFDIQYLQFPPFTMRNTVESASRTAESPSDIPKDSRLGGSLWALLQYTQQRLTFTYSYPRQAQRERKGIGQDDYPPPWNRSADDPERAIPGRHLYGLDGIRQNTGRESVISDMPNSLY